MSRLSVTEEEDARVADRKQSDTTVLLKGQRLHIL